jgi:hypothetical protein
MWQKHKVQCRSCIFVVRIQSNDHAITQEAKINGIEESLPKIVIIIHVHKEARHEHCDAALVEAKASKQKLHCVCVCS